MLRRHFLDTVTGGLGTLLALRRDSASPAPESSAEPGDWPGTVYVREHLEARELAGDGVVDDLPGLMRLGNTAGPGGGLVIDRVHAIGADWEVPCNVRFTPGGGLRWLRARRVPTVSFRAGFEAGPHRIFHDCPAGGVRFGRRRENGEWIGEAPEVRAAWWGASASAPAHQNTAAVRAAATALPQAGGSVVLEAGYFPIAGLELARDGVTLRGQGPIATVLRFEGTEGIAVRFAGERDTPRQFLGLRDLRLYGDATHAAPGTAAGLVVEHTENWFLDNVYVSGFRDGLVLDGAYGGRFDGEVIILHTVRGIHGRGTQLVQLDTRGLRHMDPIGPPAERRSILVETGISDSVIGALQLQGTVEIRPRRGGVLGNLTFEPGTRISDTSGAGLLIDGERAATAYNVRVDGLTVEETDGDGVSVRYVEDLSVSGVTVRHAGRSGEARGIVLEAVNGGLVDGFQIRGAPGGGMRYGLEARDCDSLVVGRLARVSGYSEAPLRTLRLTRSRVELDAG